MQGFEQITGIASRLGAGLAVACAVTSTLAAGVASAATPVAPQPISSPSPLTPEICGGAVLAGLESAVSIAVDPDDSKHLVAAWSQDRIAGVVVATSHDGGASWERSVPPAMATCRPDEPMRVTEPRVAVTGDGSTFVGTFIRDNVTTGAGRILVSHRGSGDAAWGVPTEPQPPGFVAAGDFDDLTADPDNHDGAYVLWGSPEGLPEPSFLSHTVDGGAHWQVRPVRVAAPGTAAWSQLVALPGDRLVIVFEDSPHAEFASPTAVPAQIFAISSEDDGASWTAPVRLGDGAALQWPSVAASADGSLYASWVRSMSSGSCRRWPLGAGGGSCEIVVTRSDDGGRIWNPPVAVAAWNGPWMPTPGLAVAGNGTVGVAYTAPESSSHGNAWLAHSRDCGRTWTSERLGGPFAVDGSTGEADGFGLYQELAGLPRRLAAAFVQGPPIAEPGDVFYAAPEVGPRRGRCQ